MISLLNEEKKITQLISHSNTSAEWMGKLLDVMNIVLQEGMCVIESRYEHLYNTVVSVIISILFIFISCSHLQIEMIFFTFYIWSIYQTMREMVCTFHQ